MIYYVFFSSFVRVMHQHEYFAMIAIQFTHYRSPYFGFVGLKHVDRIVLGLSVAFGNGTPPLNPAHAPATGLPWSDSSSKLRFWKEKKKKPLLLLLWKEISGVLQLHDSLISLRFFFPWQVKSDGVERDRRGRLTLKLSKTFCLGPGPCLAATA